MRKVLVWAVMAGVFACGPSKAQRTGSQSSDLSTATAELRRGLLTSHATFDGVPLIDLKPTERCEAVIATSRGSTSVHWKDMGALISRLKDGQRVFYVPFGGRPHTIAMPNGDAANGIDMGLGLLDEECGGVKPAG